MYSHNREVLHASPNYQLIPHIHCGKSIAKIYLVGELINLAVATRIKLQDLRGNSLSDPMFDILIKTLEVPTDAIWKWDQ